MMSVWISVTLINTWARGAARIFSPTDCTPDTRYGRNCDINMYFYVILNDKRCKVTVVFTNVLFFTYQSRYVQTCTFKKYHVQWQNVIVDIRFLIKQCVGVRDAEGEA